MPGRELLRGSVSSSTTSKLEILRWLYMGKGNYFRGSTFCDTLLPKIKSFSSQVGLG